MNCSKNKNVAKKTLDTQHINKLQGFLSKEETIQKIHNKKNALIKELASYDKKKQELNDEEFDKFISIQDEIAILNKDIQNIDKTFDEVDYYINTAPILFKYYDILEKGNNNNEENKMNLTSNSILKYFIPQTSNVKPECKPDGDDRATLLDKYMCYNSYNYYKEIESDCKDKCQQCSSSNRNIMLNDGLIICNNCSTIENIIIDHDRPSYKDPPQFLKGTHKRKRYEFFIGDEKQQGCSKRIRTSKTFKWSLKYTTVASTLSY
jgi:hypothetical protein